MLTHITTERVRAIIHLSDLAAEAADQLAGGMVSPQADQEPRGGEPPRGSSVATPVKRLEAAIAELSLEARTELHAIYLIGRGEFGAREWVEALEAATERANESEPRILAERSGLGPQLSKGLYLLKLS